MKQLINHPIFTPPFGCQALAPQPWGYGRHGSVPLEVMRDLWPMFQAFGPKLEIQVPESSGDSLTPSTDPQ